MNEAEAPSRRRVATVNDARTLVADVVAALDKLEVTLERETGLMETGRINEALDLATAKQEQAGLYMRLLESVKANAIALARFAPDSVEALRTRHGGFSSKLQVNQTVIATVKAISEQLIRGLQQETTASRTLSVYGPGASAVVARPASAAPLALSVRL